MTALDNIRLKESKIPVKYRGMSLDEYKSKFRVSYDTNALDTVETWIRTWPGAWIRSSEDPDYVGTGLLFHATPGKGKTTLAAVILGEIITRYGTHGMFVPMADYIRLLFDNMTWEKRYGDPEADANFWSTRKLLDKVNDLPLVVLDDVGKEYKSNSGFVVDEFDRLIRSRYRRGLPTIITTNLLVSQWAGDYGEPMYSFINEAFVSIKLAGEDNRIIAADARKLVTPTF